MMNPFSDGKRHIIGLDLCVKGFAPDRVSRAYLALTNTRESDRLILECATLAEMDDEYNEGELLEEGLYESVIVRRFSQTDSRMKALARVFSKHLPEGIAPAEAIIGKPKKSGLFANVTAQIPFSDGQAITIVFHSPSGDAKKIGPDDEIVAYRWLLNKRDITLVVSPEGEGDVSLEEVGKRIAQLVAKNSARFQSTQKDVKAQNDQLVTLKAEADTLSTENVALMNGLRDQQSAAETTQAKITMTQGLLEKQQEINADLENQIAALNVKAKADEAARAVAAETAAKQAADEAEAVAKQAADQKVIDELAYAKYQRETAEREVKRIELDRLRELGRSLVPGLRLGDQEWAGQLWESLQKGEYTQAQWDKYVEDLYSSGKAPRPETVVPEVTPVVPEVVAPPPVKSKASGPAWKLPIEDVKAMDEKRYQKAFDALEDKNAHSQSIVLLAKRLGTPDDVAEAENILAEHIAEGELTHELQKRRYALVSRIHDTEVTPEPSPQKVVITKGDLNLYNNWMKTELHVGKKENGWDVFQDDTLGGYLLLTRYNMVTHFDTEKQARQWASSNKPNTIRSMPEVTPEPVAPEAAAEPPEVPAALPPAIDWNDRSDEERDRLKNVGLNVLPDINPLFAEDAGELWERLQRGDATQEQWDRYVKAAVTTPAAVTVANNIISGKYDSLPLKDILKLSEPIWDLDEAAYYDLMSKADAYLTQLTKEASAKVMG